MVDTSSQSSAARFIAELLYLRHAYDSSDKVIINTWVKNPYVQHFTGETHFQIESPLDSYRLTPWRKRIAEEGIKTLLMVSIEAARQLGMMKEASVDRIIIDTTVMPKAIAHPTDSRLLDKGREHPVKLATEPPPLRQCYNREPPHLAAQAGRHAHAKQYKRMQKAVCTLKTWANPV